MKKTYLLFIIIALNTFSVAQAHTVKDFCSEVSQSRVQKSQIKNGTKFIWKLLLNPESLVELKKIPTSYSEYTNTNRIKLAFLSLPFAQMTEAENSEFKQLELTRKNIVKELKKPTELPSAEECQEYIARENLETKIARLGEIAPRYIELKQLQSEAGSYAAQNKKQSFLKRNGWIVFKNKNLNEMYSIIKETKPNDILIIGHASNDGKIYDSLKNPIPRSFFQALNIENLILYSCYSEEAKNYYTFNNYNIFLAYPTGFATSFLDKSVPLNSLRSVKKIELKSLKTTSPKICSLSFPISETSKLLGVTLNKIFIGPVSPRIDFPCSLLTSNSSIEIFASLAERQIGPIGFSTIFYNGSAINLEEFKNNKTNRHIVSRGILITERSF